ncbi:uncharacterized protein LOC122961754 [Acropora millepora]|uniref:uncharacterized protein LOC122961754 n=1 Tax=Acropora millepora TaxID=45264 RepID=UPI001CF0EFDC|nr:uncharacterized protein LOC122961754 [Acropora millepora]
MDNTHLHLLVILPHYLPDQKAILQTTSVNALTITNSQYSWTSFQSHNDEKTSFQLNFYTVFIFSMAEANNILWKQLLRRHFCALNRDKNQHQIEQGTIKTNVTQARRLCRRERDESHAGHLEHQRPLRRPSRWSDHHREEAAKTRKRCYKCGKIGHINKNCTSATKKRAQKQTMTGTNNLPIIETSSILAFYRFNFLNLVTTFYHYANEYITK